MIVGFLMGLVVGWGGYQMFHGHALHELAVQQYLQRSKHEEEQQRNRIYRGTAKEMINAQLQKEKRAWD